MLVARKLLENAGCLVDCAKNGIDGLEMFDASAEWYYDDGRYSSRHGPHFGRGVHDYP
jgi:CheY-like chemotaxis protein